MLAVFSISPNSFGGSDNSSRVASFSGTASYYTPEEWAGWTTKKVRVGTYRSGPKKGRDIYRTKRVPQDGWENRDGSRYKHGDGHCAVSRKRWNSLKHHTLEVCSIQKGSQGVCQRCYVTDSGSGVNGVDLTPEDWAKFGHQKSLGRIKIVIKDLGLGDARPSRLQAKNQNAEARGRDLVTRVGSYFSGRKPAIGEQRLKGPCFPRKNADHFLRPCSRISQPAASAEMRAIQP